VWNDGIAVAAGRTLSRPKAVSKWQSSGEASRSEFTGMSSAALVAHSPTWADSRTEVILGCGTVVLGEHRAVLCQPTGVIGLTANGTRMVWEILASYMVREGSIVT
jgi:hypothetical protein